MQRATCVLLVILLPKAILMVQLFIHVQQCSVKTYNVTAIRGLSALKQIISLQCFHSTMHFALQDARWQLRLVTGRFIITEIYRVIGLIVHA